MNGNPPNRKEVTTFTFKLMCRLKVFQNQGDIKLDSPLRLICAASKYGLLFVGTPKGIQCIRTENVYSTEACRPNSRNVTSYPRRDLNLGGQPTHLDVSSDGEHLAVAVTVQGIAVLYIYSITSFGSSEISKKNEVRLSSTSGVFVSDLQWNTGIPNMIAVVMTDGSAAVIEFKDGSFMINSIPQNSQASCLCWSPKGKQVVIGAKNGSLTQYKPELKAVRTFPPPQLGTAPISVISVHWLSNFQFIAIFRDSSSKSSCLVVNVPKNGPMTHVNYYDFCFEANTSRPEHYFIHAQPWNILILGTTNGMEVNVLGMEEENSWGQYLQDESSRAELPLTENHQDVYNIGMSLDTSPTQDLLMGVGPVPVLVMYSSDGVLCLFHTINTMPGAIQLCKNPEPLPLLNGLHLFTIPQEEVASPITPAKEESKPVIREAEKPVFTSAPFLPANVVQQTSPHLSLSTPGLPQMSLNFGQSQIPNLGLPQISSISQSQLPGSVQSQMPGSIQSPLPGSIQSQLPGSIQSQLPGSVQSQAPASVQSQGPQSSLGLPQSLGLAQTQIPALAQTQIPGSAQTQILGSAQSQIPGSAQTQNPGLAQTQILGSGQTPFLGFGQGQRGASGVPSPSLGQSPSLGSGMMGFAGLGQPLQAKPTEPFSSQQPSGLFPPFQGGLNLSQGLGQSTQPPATLGRSLIQPQTRVQPLPQASPFSFSQSSETVKQQVVVPSSATSKSSELPPSKGTVSQSQRATGQSISSSPIGLSTQQERKEPLELEPSRNQDLTTVTPEIQQVPEIPEPKEDPAEAERIKQLCQELLLTFTSEMENKQKVVQKFVAKTYNNISESRIRENISINIDVLSKFEVELKSTLAPDQTKINALRSSIMEIFGWYEKVKAKERMTKSAGYIELMESQDLDPVTKNYLKSIDRHVYYLESQIKQAKAQLGSLWDNIESTMEVPVMEVIYQSLVGQINILSAKKALISSFEKKLSKIHKKTTPQLQRRKPIDLSKDVELSALAEQLLDTTLSDRDIIKDSSLKKTANNYIALSNRMSARKLNTEKVTALCDWHRNHKIITTKVGKRSPVVDVDTFKDYTFINSEISPAKQSTPYPRTPRKSSEAAPRKSLFTMPSITSSTPMANQTLFSAHNQPEKTQHNIKDNNILTVEEKNNLTSPIAKFTDTNKIVGLQNKASSAHSHHGMTTILNESLSMASKENSSIPTPAAFKGVPQANTNSNVISTAWGSQTPKFGPPLFSANSVGSSLTIFPVSSSPQVTNQPTTSFSFNSFSQVSVSTASSPAPLALTKPVFSGNSQQMPVISSISPPISDSQKLNTANIPVVKTDIESYVPKSSGGVLSPSSYTPTPVKTSTPSSNFPTVGAPSSSNFTSVNIISNPQPGNTGTGQTSIVPITTTKSGSQSVGVTSPYISNSTSGSPLTNIVPPVKQPVFSAITQVPSLLATTTTSSVFGGTYATPIFIAPSTTATSIFGSASTTSPTLEGSTASTTPSIIAGGTVSFAQSTPPTPSVPNVLSATISSSTPPSPSVISLTPSSATPNSKLTTLPSSIPETPKSSILSGGSIFGGTANSSPSLPSLTSSSTKGIFSNAASTTASIFSVTSTTATTGTTISSSIFGLTSKTPGTTISRPIFGNATAFTTDSATPATPIFGEADSTPPPTLGTAQSSPVFSGSLTPTTTLTFGTATTSTPAFGTPTTTSSVFGASATTTPVFRTPTTTASTVFGTPTTTAPIFGATTTSSIFGGGTMFGTAITTNSSFVSVTQQNSVFGATSALSSSSFFGSPTTTGGTSFGTPAAASIFGGSFGTPTTTSSASFFGKPICSPSTASNVFGATSNIFGQAAATAPAFGGTGFQQKAPFGQTTTNVFGQTAPNSSGNFGSSGGSLFGSGSTFGNPSTQQQANIFQSGATGGNIWGSGGTAGPGPFSSGVQTGQSSFGAPPTFQQANERPFGAVANTSVFGSSAAFPAAPTFGGSPTFGSASPNKVFGSSTPAVSTPQSFGSPTQQSSTFENLAGQDTLSFGNLAQQQTFQGSSFGGSSFNTWR